MLLISHRGNLKGPQPDLENNPDYVDKAISFYYDVEVDLWVKEKTLYLGHDSPQYPIHPSWLRERNHRLWIHCKDTKSLSFLSRSEGLYNYFWHSKDKYALTSKGYIWCYPGSEPVGPRAICVMPEKIWSLESIKSFDNPSWYGMCSDYVDKLDEVIE